MVNHKAPIPKYLIIELRDPLTNALNSLLTNTEYPTIDPDALMSAILESLCLPEAFSPSSKEEEICYVLQETLGNVGKDITDEVRKKIIDDTTIVVDEIWLKLKQIGVFIDGEQPYEFAKFINSKTALLRKTEISNY